VRLCRSSNLSKATTVTAQIDGVIGLSTPVGETQVNGIYDQLMSLAKQWNCAPTDRKFAEMLDQHDPLRHFRQLFFYPKKRDLPDSK
jgi:hypothetical protein